MSEEGCPEGRPFSCNNDSNVHHKVVEKANASSQRANDAHNGPKHDEMEKSS